MKPIIPILLATLAGLAPCCAEVRLPAFFSNHMVLQKHARVPIWGKANPGEAIKVTLNGQAQSATTDAHGKWMVCLDLNESAAGPFEMTIEGTNKIVLSDVVVGELWIASGQSNMEFALSSTLDGAREIAGSANPMLRHFKVAKHAAEQPLDEVSGTWVAADPGTSGSFTAVGYYFAKKLQSELKVPVGILNSSWGGTPSEAWTSLEALESVPELKAAHEQTQEQLGKLATLKKAYTDALSAWLKDSGREDRSTSDTAPFAAIDATTEGWTQINAGEAKGERLPNAGAIWVRKEIELPPTKGNWELRLFPGNALDTIYWNGKLLKKPTQIQDVIDIGATRKTFLSIPARAVVNGRNVLAIRFYSPISPAKFKNPEFIAQSGEIKLFPGKWLAKAEFELPAPTADQLAKCPKPVPAITGCTYAAQMFNGMINPLLPYAMRGVIWYQGESNTSNAFQYRKAFPTMIADWRNRWGRGDFPFYFCQLANMTPKASTPAESAWAELREAQSMTLSLPNTGQAVLIDLGESGDIHPRNKKDVGERLARIALAKEYGRQVEYSGPVFDGMRIEQGHAVLRFKHTAGGLVAAPVPETYNVITALKQTARLVRNSPNSQLEGFAISGADHRWVWADAKIEGESVVVSSEKVATPVAVRYAWANNPTCNLYNRAGLPASPFRTDGEKLP